MFLGQYQHSLDDKGRLTIPAAFRASLAEGAFISQGYDRNLMVMTTAYFQQVYAGVNAMSVTDATARLLRRMIFSTAYQVEVDKAGRVLVPQNLREFLGMDGEAMVVGQGEYFEVWTPGEWQRQTKSMQDVDTDPQRFQALNLGV
jgi:MraZ protein